MTAIGLAAQPRDIFTAARGREIRLVRARNRKSACSRDTSSAGLASFFSANIELAISRVCVRRTLPLLADLVLKFLAPSKRTLVFLVTSPAIIPADKFYARRCHARVQSVLLPPLRSKYTLALEEEARTQVQKCVPRSLAVLSHRTSVSYSAHA